MTKNCTNRRNKIKNGIVHGSMTRDGAKNKNGFGSDTPSPLRYEIHKYLWHFWEDKMMSRNVELK